MLEIGGDDRFEIWWDGDDWDDCFYIDFENFPAMVTSFPEIFFEVDYSAPGGTEPIYIEIEKESVHVKLEMTYEQYDTITLSTLDIV